MQIPLPFDSAVSVPPNVQFYFVRQKRARRYVLRVDHDGRVRVTIPRGGSQREAMTFGLRHLDWITGQRARLPATALSVSERRSLRERASQELPALVLEVAARHGLRVTRISVRDQRTRWGSCGRDGHICLNWRLLLMPQSVRDYVLVHELMHLRQMNHSRRYWALVADACPDYRTARQWLREHGDSLR